MCGSCWTGPSCHKGGPLFGVKVKPARSPARNVDTPAADALAPGMRTKLLRTARRSDPAALGVELAPTDHREDAPSVRARSGVGRRGRGRPRKVGPREEAGDPCCDGHV